MSATITAPSTELKGEDLSKLDQLSINTIRTLAMDAVQTANSGHPGAPMGAAPMAYVLWTRFLKHNPRHPRLLRAGEPRDRSSDRIRSGSAGSFCTGYAAGAMDLAGSDQRRDPFPFDEIGNHASAGG